VGLFIRRAAFFKQALQVIPAGRTCLLEDRCIAGPAINPGEHQAM